MNMKRTLHVLCALAAFAMAAYLGSLSETASAQTATDIIQLVTHAKTAAEHQKLVKWYEQREAEVRNQAKLYQTLAGTYRDFYKLREMAIACDKITGYYDDIAEQYEKLAEEHRHMAASSQ